MTVALMNYIIVASEKKALADLQTAQFTVRSRDFTERRDALVGIINVCTQTLDGLKKLSDGGLEGLSGTSFLEWLCDIGLCRLQTALKDIDGRTLTMLNVDNVIGFDVTFADAAALQLRGYIAHYKLSVGSALAPPSDSVLSWTAEKTANWIKSLGSPYACLAAAEWHGAALCSLSPPRVIEASKGALKAPDAVNFIGLVRTKRSETDGDKASWVAKWNGLIPIDLQAA